MGNFESVEAYVSWAHYCQALSKGIFTEKRDGKYNLDLICKPSVPVSQGHLVPQWQLDEGMSDKARHSARVISIRQLEPAAAPHFAVNKKTKKSYGMISKQPSARFGQLSNRTSLLPPFEISILHQTQYSPGSNSSAYILVKPKLKQKLKQKQRWNSNNKTKKTVRLAWLEQTTLWTGITHATCISRSERGLIIENNGNKLPLRHSPNTCLGCYIFVYTL